MSNDAGDLVVAHGEGFELLDDEPADAVMIIAPRDPKHRELYWKRMSAPTPTARRSVTYEIARHLDRGNVLWLDLFQSIEAGGTYSGEPR